MNKYLRHSKITLCLDASVKNLHRSLKSISVDREVITYLREITHSFLQGHMKNRMYGCRVRERKLVSDVANFL